MAKNKKKILKPNPSEIKVSNPTFDKLQKANNRKPLFKMSPKTKRKINAILATGMILTSGFQIAANALSAPPMKQEKQYIIAIANNNAQITIDGQEHKIDPNSFVIVSDNNALAYDENGNILRGFIDNEDFTEIKTMTENEMSNYNIYQISTDSEVNVRATAGIEDNNIISTVQAQDYVLGYSQETPEYDDEWISTLSVNGNNIYEGYIREDLIQELGSFELIYDTSVQDLKNIMKVDTSKDGNIALNLRTTPETYEKLYIMTTIPDGSTVQKTGQNYNNWTQIEYETADGSKLTGWVASEYLTPYFSESEIAKFSPVISQTPVIQQEENQEKSQENSTVTGIDISTISPDELRELFQNGIPDQVSTTYGYVDTSQISGDINFAYIKLGASPYGNGEFAPVDYDFYKEQVKVCEEFGIPYGFYYYSTSTTVDEAKIELQHIKQKIFDLKQNINIKNNKLEIVVDIELAGSDDRQYQGDISEQTEAKATLINGIQNEGLSDNVLIYGPNRVMKPDSDQIIDLSYLNSILSNPDNVALWMCSPTSRDGQLPSNLERDEAYAKEQGFSTVVHQVVLDSTVIGQIDINTMDLEHFEELTQSREYDEYER